MDTNELTDYMGSFADRLVSNALRSSIRDPKEMAFLIKFGVSVKKANRLRSEYETKGLHVPAFLISSITTSCNLFCKGCYARANGICGKPQKVEMGIDNWKSVFSQAEGLGISFNILAGGEPLMRNDIVEVAGKMKHTVFPIFTNGTMIDDVYLHMFQKYRNLIPIFSLEGNRESTDERRGVGTYDTVIDKMVKLRDNVLFYGVSVTLMEGKTDEVTSEEFISTLHELGCRIVFFIEFIPVKSESMQMAPTDVTRRSMEVRLSELRSKYDDMMFMSFPGDEKFLGGCLGAGRGFFHINPYGDAEACPASPYSDVNLINSSLEDVLRSKLFSELRKEGLLEGDHSGGCILLEKEDKVRELANINRTV